MNLPFIIRATSASLSSSLSAVSYWLHIDYYIRIREGMREKVVGGGGFGDGTLGVEEMDDERVDEKSGGGVRRSLMENLAAKKWGGERDRNQGGVGDGFAEDFTGEEESENSKAESGDGLNAEVRRVDGNARRGGGDSAEEDEKMVRVAGG